MEELVAELGAAFLCAALGITNEPRPDHAAYLATWLKVLKQDSRAIFSAAHAAQEAFEYPAHLATKNGSDRLMSRQNNHGHDASATAIHPGRHGQVPSSAGPMRGTVRGAAASPKTCRLVLQPVPFNLSLCNVQRLSVHGRPTPRCRSGALVFRHLAHF